MSAKPSAVVALESRDKALIREIGVGLQQIANCLAVLALNTRSVKDLNKTKRTDLLEKFGFDRKSTAAILRSSPVSLGVLVYKARKAGKAGKPPAK